MHKDIIIKKSKTADTRTCDWSTVTKDQLLDSSIQHISDVIQGLNLISNKLKEIAWNHDNSKVSHIDAFYNDFKSGFEKKDWWKFHQETERHHFNSPEYIQDDVNLLDVLEQIVDGVMAGLSRSGEYRKEVPSAELLVKAYENTAKMLLENIKVEE